MKTRTVPRAPMAAGRRRWGRAQLQAIEDPYKRAAKLKEPTQCPQCRAVYHKGRWQWGPAPADAHQELCQACHRINDKFPAGTLTLAGDFVAAHRADMLAIVRHQEELEKKEHPLNRIMSIEEAADRIVITTTDIHLPRRIGEAVKRTFRGKLELQFDEDAYSARIDWRRDA